MESYQHNVEMHGNSIIMRGKSDRDWTYISCSSEKEMQEICELGLINDKAFAAIEDWMLPFLKKERKISWELNCIRLVLPRKKIKSTFPELPALKEEDAEIIFRESVYKSILNVAYIKERITKGLSSSIIKNGKLVAWAMTQDDGSMGFLHVTYPYRGNGYALQLTTDLSRKVSEKERIPFVQIEKSNRTSIELAKKAGFVFDRNLNWFVSE